MKKPALALLLPLTLLISACSLFPFTPTIGATSEKKWLRNTVSSDLVYIEGNVKAYRAGSAYYYFRDGVLVRVAPGLVSADKI